jgi:hypothetical protein
LSVLLARIQHDMPDSTISEVPCANNELRTDTYDKSDVLKIDTFDKLDDLLRTAEKHDLAASGTSISTTTSTTMTRI